MSVNLGMLKKAGARARIHESISETINLVTSPFNIYDLYPAREVVDESGKPRLVKQIFPHQKKVHDGLSMSGRKFKAMLFASGVGAGKSLCMCAEMVKGARLYPGLKTLVVMPYDWMYDETLFPTWTTILPWESPFIHSYNSKTRVLRCVNGSTFWFHTFDDPDKIKGFEVGRIWIEEASEIGDGNSEKGMQIWMALQQRLRQSGNYPLDIFVSMNPKGHNWTWKVFIRDNMYGDEGCKTECLPSRLNPQGMSYWEYEKEIDDPITSQKHIYYSIRTSTTSNTFLPAGYAGNMLAQMSENPDLKLRMVEGGFNPINLLVYDSWIFSERTHVIQMESFLEYWDVPYIPRWWPVIVGIDPAGQASPWAAEFYVETPNGELVCYDEIYVKQKTYPEIASMILDKTVGLLKDSNGSIDGPRNRTNALETVRYFVDPIAGNQRQGQNAKTIKMEFRRFGLNCEQPDGYGKDNGCQRVWSLMYRDRSRPCPYLHDDLDDTSGDYEIGAARLYYIDGCCKANLAEKKVFRRDSRKMRQPKEFEEGLTPYESEKILDRDDHAQTAEFFATLGWKPYNPDIEHWIEPSEPQLRYAVGGRQAGMKAHRKSAAFGPG